MTHPRAEVQIDLSGHHRQPSAAVCIAIIAVALITLEVARGRDICTPNGSQHIEATKCTMRVLWHSVYQVACKPSALMVRGVHGVL